jgi:hypothetical protein
MESPVAQRHKKALTFLILASVLLLVGERVLLTIYQIGYSAEFLRVFDENQYLIEGNIIFQALENNGLVGILESRPPGLHVGYSYLNGLLYWLVGKNDPRIMYLFNTFLFVMTLFILYKLLRKINTNYSVSLLILALFALSPESVQYTIINLKESIVLFLWFSFFYVCVGRGIFLPLVLMIAMIPFRSYLLFPELAFYLIVKGIRRSTLILIASVFCGLILFERTSSWSFLEKLRFDFIVNLLSNNTTGLKSLFNPLVPSTYIYAPISFARIFLSPLPWVAQGFLGAFAPYYLMRIFLFPFFCYGILKFVISLRNFNRFCLQDRRKFGFLIAPLMVTGFYMIVDTASAVRHRLIIDPFFYYFIFYSVGMISTKKPPFNFYFTKRAFQTDAKKCTCN